VIVADRADRALRMLRNFSVAAVVYDLPTLDAVPQLAALGTPLIVLATPGDPGAAGVVVLPRDTAPAAVADAIRQRTRELGAAAAHV
jgi:hypothetical protein